MRNLRFGVSRALSLLAVVALPACGGESPSVDAAIDLDGGGLDASREDASSDDASRQDASREDASRDDASPEDASLEDASLDGASGEDASLGDDAGVVCEPGSVEACYSGPAATAGVGVCAAGTRTCGVDGLGFGACVGEVLPGVERCETSDDEDCDGRTPGCGDAAWAHLVGGTADEALRDVALLADGSVVAVGSIRSATDFGCGVVTPSSSAGSAVLVHFAAEGGCITSRTFGADALTSSLDHVEALVDGGVVVAGSAVGMVDFGGGPLVGVGARDALVARFAADGALVWSRRMGGAGATIGVRGFAATPGRLALVGDFTGSFDVGAGALASLGATDAYVVFLDDTSGLTMLARRWGAASDQTAEDVAFDAAGNAVVVGEFFGTVDFGAGPAASAGDADVFVVSLDPAGASRWSQHYGDAAAQSALAVTTTTAGDVVFGGQLAGSVDFGGGLRTASGRDAFLVRLSAAGAHVHSARFGDASNQAIDALAALPDGSVVAGGGLSGGIDLGGGSIFSAGGGDFFLARLDATGGHVWSRAYGGGGSDVLGGIAPDGVVLVFAGAASSALDVGTGLLTATGGTDALVAYGRL